MKGGGIKRNGVRKKESERERERKLIFHFASIRTHADHARASTALERTHARTQVRTHARTRTHASSLHHLCHVARTQARTHAARTNACRRHARMPHARTHARRTHARTHARTQTGTCTPPSATRTVTHRGALVYRWRRPTIPTHHNRTEFAAAPHLRPPHSEPLTGLAVTRSLAVS